MSVVVPCYNEEKSVFNFYSEFIKVYENDIKEGYGLSYELVFIDDGSVDKTLNCLKELSKKELYFYFKEQKCL